MNSRPFHWTVGILQLFVTNMRAGGTLFVPASMAEYDRDKPVGSPWERAVATNAVKRLNALARKGAQLSEQDVKAAIRAAEKATQWRST